MKEKNEDGKRKIYNVNISIIAAADFCYQNKNKSSCNCQDIKHIEQIM